MLTNQMKEWQGTTGQDYTERNLQSVQEMESIHKRNYGVTRTEINLEFLGGLDRSLKILEVGCNIGNQLLCLQKIGFRNLYGAELQPYAARIAEARLQNTEIFQGSIFNLPFETRSFDLVFTSGVLIHINPSAIKNALKEVYRCTRAYIWGFEYYAKTCEEIKWHGKDNMLWRNDFVKLYQKQFKDLKLIQEKHFKYLHSGCHKSVGTMFLLKKEKE